jgi:hypothetical protein
MDPPRKGAALNGPCFIHSAFLLFEKDAVMRVRKVDERNLMVYCIRIICGKFFYGYREVMRESLYVTWREKDVATR